MIRKAMILAAGFGKRLNPLTIDLPKPLLKIGKETLLSNTLKFLKSYGIEEVVVNVHYLRDQILNYIKSEKFRINIKIVEEKNNILDTGGGILNALNYFSNEPFLVINPDTVWNLQYLNELKKMEELFFKNEKIKSLLLIVNKNKSFDKSLKGDFSLKKNLISRKKEDNLNYIYTGLQIINPSIFINYQEKVFSINKIWNILLEKNELYGIESDINFHHVSNLEIYKKLLTKIKH